MAQVIPFRLPAAPAESEVGFEIDLITAVDVAIRDLRDIRGQVHDTAARRQAEECLAMLEHALDTALADG